MKWRTLLCIAAMATVLPTPLLAQDQAATETHHHRYRLKQIGTSAGPNVELAVEPIAQIVNNRGTAVGEADTSAPNPYYPNGNPFVGGGAYVGHAFSFQRGLLTDLGTLPGGLNSGAVWINQNGLVAGISENGEIDPLLGFPEGIAVLWQDGHVINLGTLDGGYESVANAVNRLGSSRRPRAEHSSRSVFDVGSWNTDAGVSLGKRRHARPGHVGRARRLRYLHQRPRGSAGQSYTNSTPNPVLDGCGGYTTNVPTQDPFLWKNGKMMDLGTLGGSCGGANGLNQRGEVVGQSDVSGDQSFHAFLWRHGKIQELGYVWRELQFCDLAQRQRRDRWLVNSTRRSSAPCLLLEGRGHDRYRGPQPVSVQRRSCH